MVDTYTAIEPKRKTTSKRRELPERYQAMATTAASLLVVLGIWEMVARAGLVTKVFFVGPSDVGADFAKLIGNGQLLGNLQISMVELFAGFGLAVVTAVPVGLAIGTFRRTEIVLSPYLMAFYSTPRVAFFPIIVGVLGFGLGSQIVLVYLAAFFPICINVWSGVKTVDPVLVNAGKSFCASRGQMFTKIIIPYCVPFIVAGLRLAVGRALMAIYVAELLGANAGIGFMIVRAGLEFRTGELFVGIIALGLLGIVLTETVRYVERRVAPWRKMTTL